MNDYVKSLIFWSELYVKKKTRTLRESWWKWQRIVEPWLSISGPMQNFKREDELTRHFEWTPGRLAVDLNVCSSIILKTRICYKSNGLTLKHCPHSIDFRYHLLSKILVIILYGIIGRKQDLRITCLAF